MLGQCTILNMSSFTICHRNNFHNGITFNRNVESIYRYILQFLRLRVIFLILRIGPVVLSNSQLISETMNPCQTFGWITNSDGGPTPRKAYTYTTQDNTYRRNSDISQCPEQDSNPRFHSQKISRQEESQTSRPLLSAEILGHLNKRQFSVNGTLLVHSAHNLDLTDTHPGIFLYIRSGNFLVEP